MATGCMVRKRLWKAGGLLASLILTICIGNFFLPRDKAFDSHMYGHDFLPFYTAGEIIRMGWRTISTIRGRRKSSSTTPAARPD